MTKINAIAGEVYGEWTLINFSRMKENQGQFWVARCSCGFEGERQLCQIRSGKTNKCRECRNKELSKMSTFAIGEKAPNWKGGKSTTRQGYIVLSGHKGHPNANKKGLIKEHTLIMSNSLGRPLLPQEQVHHKNGIRSDNNLDNLELWTRIQPTGTRVEDRINWAIEFLKIYGYTVMKEHE